MYAVDKKLEMVQYRQYVEEHISNVRKIWERARREHFFHGAVGDPYGNFLHFLIPPLVFFYSLTGWRKNGNEPVD